MPKPGKPGWRPSRWSNPLGRWLDSRKEQQKQLEEQAARMISGKIEDNAMRLMDTLNSVDFIHSALPERLLTDCVEGYPICRMEWDTKALMQMIRSDRQNTNMDIRPIDEKLMTLALMLRQFVDHGDVMASRMALDALSVGIQDIRCKLPVCQPDLAEAFVREHAGYLGNWITLVGIAQRYDHTERCLEEAQAALREAEQRRQARTEKIEDRIKNDAAFCMTFFYIHDHDTPADRANWTDTHREVRAMLLDAKREDFKVKLYRRLCVTYENDLTAVRQQMASARFLLNRLPIVFDPGLMNQYRDSMAYFMRSMIETDIRTEETLNTAEQLSDALVQLEESFHGSVLAQEAGLEYSREVLERFPTEPDPARVLKEQSWLTKEEREAQRSEARKEIEEMPVQDLARELFGDLLPN